MPVSKTDAAHWADPLLNKNFISYFLFFDLQYTSRIYEMYELIHFLDIALIFIA